MELTGKVAVVTGAASGIGKGLANRFAREGMKVVLADIEEIPLREATESLKANGAEVIAVRTDVSLESDVENLAREAVDQFGGVHVVCSNAGVVLMENIWTMRELDWRWMCDVNIGGTLNCMRVFVPILSDQGEGHIVFTSSIAGVTTALWGAYSVTKHAIVAASEALYHSLVAAGSPLGVTVLLPGWVKESQIATSVRNRQDRFVDTSAPEQVPNPDLVTMLQSAIDGGMEPDDFAGLVVNAIHERQFYVYTHPETIPQVRMRADDLLNARPPTAMM